MQEATLQHISAVLEATLKLRVIIKNTRYCDVAKRAKLIKGKDLLYEELKILPFFRNEINTNVNAYITSSYEESIIPTQNKRNMHVFNF